MPKKNGKVSSEHRWLKADKSLRECFPQVFSVLGEEDAFISVLVKRQPDGTMLAVLKRFGPDGGPMVCFGSGYGFAGCFMGLDGTVAVGKWRVDKPYRAKA